jgi:hypothetical protein
MDAVKHFLIANREAIFTFTSVAAALAIATYAGILVIRLVTWILTRIAEAFRSLRAAIEHIMVAVVLINTTMRGAFRPRSPLDVPLPKFPRRVFTATHFVYLCTFVIGVTLSAKTLVEYVAPLVTKDLMFVFPMLVFSAANCIHQSLIYRDLREAEDPQTIFFRRYDGWWLGIGVEKALRILAMICLLALAGESQLDRLQLFEKWQWTLPEPHRFVMLANCGLYFLILIWNTLARLRIRWYKSEVLISMKTDSAVRDAKSQLNQSIVSDALALFLWIAVVNVNERRQLFAAVITTMAVVYLINIVWYRPRVQTQQRPRDRLQRIFFAFSIIAVLAALDFADIKRALEANVQIIKQL